MKILYYSLTLALILINLACVTALFSRWIPSFALARATGVLTLGLIFFFTEHFIGLGQLNGFWVVTTSIAGIILYWRRSLLFSCDFLRAEVAFGLALFYGLSWKWAFPVIYPTSERVTDLYFIGNYLAGTKLPPVDHWFPTQHFDFYYSFQHYMASLMGRIFNLTPGLTYNFAFVILMALSITLAWAFTGCFLSRQWKRWLIIISFVGGGTGASVFVHLGHQNPDTNQGPSYLANQASQSMWASQRFIGLFDQQLNTSIGKQLFPQAVNPKSKPQELPLEDFGYQFFVGDYHPPLGGFFLLLMGLTLIAVIEVNSYSSSVADPHRQFFPAQISNLDFMQALLGLTVPAMIAMNTWAFPLQFALMLGWMSWRLLNRQPPNFVALLVGGGAGFVLLYPFLAGFSSQVVSTPIKWVALQDHTPIRQFLALHWPLLLFAVCSVFQSNYRRIGLCFGMVFLGLLLVSELIYIDDPSANQYERTNTVMKWWGWIWSGALVSLATLLLASKNRWLKTLIVSALLMINIYVVDVVRYWWYTDKQYAGQLAADSVYTQDATVHDMFNFLAEAADGIVLENCYGNAYTDSGIYSVFAAKPTLLGWPAHLSTWRGSVSRIWHLKDDIQQFYAGTIIAPQQWLSANKIDYIVWNAKDSQQAKADSWEKINGSITQTYYWKSFQPRQASPVGFWVKR